MNPLSMLLIAHAMAQTPPVAPAPASTPPAPAQTQGPESNVQGRRAVTESDVLFTVKNLAPTFDWSARESFLPRVIEAVDHGPF